MIKVAVFGFGTVGSGVAEVLDINRDDILKRTGLDIEVKYILDLRELSLSQIPFHPHMSWRNICFYP